MCSPGYYQSNNGPMVTWALGRTSCAQVHELRWGYWRIGNNQEGTLSVFLTTYICMYVYIYIYIYIYTFLYIYIYIYLYIISQYVYNNTYHIIIFHNTYINDVNMYILILLFILMHTNINMYIFLFINFIRIYLLFTFLLLNNTNSYAKQW